MFKEVPFNFSNDIVKGAILGSILIPFVLHFTKLIIEYLRNKFPIRALFGRLLNNNEPCYIFFVKLYDTNRQNSFLFNTPDFFPPHTSNQVHQKINTPLVWADADGQCAVDIINTLGSAGKTKNIYIKDPAKDWDLWNGNIVCIGGSAKVDSILGSCKQGMCKLSADNCKIKLPTGEELNAVFPKDYGLIQKMKNINGEFDCWILLGVGVFGTLAAGYFLKNNAKELGALYEDKEFSCVIETTVNQGPEQCSIHSLWPKPLSYKKIFHPIIWYKKLRIHKL